MRSKMDVRTFVAAGFALFAVLSIVNHCTGCAASPAEKAAAADSTYAVEQLACVERSATIEESRACRAKVRERWHVDAGGAR